MSSDRARDINVRTIEELDGLSDKELRANINAAIRANHVAAPLGLGALICSEMAPCCPPLYAGVSEEVFCPCSIEV